MADEGLEMVFPAVAFEAAFDGIQMIGVEPFLAVPVNRLFVYVDGIVTAPPEWVAERFTSAFGAGSWAETRPLTGPGIRCVSRRLANR